MMHQHRARLQFCGFGGQGIVLSSVIFGTAAVLTANLNAVQTQSYGSEARGGECQAELILAQKPIHSPLADEMDILVAMSQSALDRYLDRLRAGGTLIIDPELVRAPDRTDVQIAPVPATEIASELGARIAANMVMLGFLQQATGLVSREGLLETIQANVPQKFVELNLQAAERGIALAQEQNFAVEI
ncbi:MAG: 2-oxoacid:acceptor oxidoreductase family protein [Anaerolineae bacterium]|jgi:2-oxoglutarate ferredoxin oxidoreductase subunit gamma